ncbi:MAG: purine-nucleoside phosphorylase [Bacteroidota bacterium]
MLEAINQSVNYLREKTGDFRPEVGIILGTGLGGLVENVGIDFSIDYENIPNFPVSTVESHNGKLIFGNLGGRKIIVMQGRFHYYEGYSMQEITFPVRVMKWLGIRTLLVSNASGGVNPDFEIGDLMVITDHINFMPNPLIGKHYPEFGPRFPDLSRAYHPKLIDLVRTIGREHDVSLKEGCYLGVTGPTLETPKEYGFFRQAGADTIGMSTIPEVIVAHQMEIPCFAISVITDLGVAGKIVEVTLEDVKRAAAKAEPGMTLIFSELISRLPW